MDGSAVDYGSCILTDANNASCITMETSKCGNVKDVDVSVTSANIIENAVMNVTVLTNTWPCSEDYALIMWRSIGSKWHHVMYSVRNFSIKKSYTNII